MEVVLNELSIKPADNQLGGNAIAIDLAKTISAAVNKGYKRVRSHLSESEILLADDYSYYTWLHTNSGDLMLEQTIKPFLYGVLVTPFIDEEDAEGEKQYILSDYYFEDKENKHPKTKCTGLASAYIADTLSISFSSNNIWKKNTLHITVKTEKTVSREDVLNVFSPQCFEQNVIKKHIEYAHELQLVESKKAPNSKKIHITSHHGQKEIEQLWTKVKYSPFVLSGLSIEWGGNSFIRRTYEDGVIEIVLRKTDKGYALRVQTTGRNKRETDAIAKILQKKFDK